jgi:hypothetical protein
VKARQKGADANAEAATTRAADLAPITAMSVQTTSQIVRLVLVPADRLNRNYT